MPTMGRYCKAYPISRLQNFSEFSMNTENLRTETRQIDGKFVDVRRGLAENDFLYLQENYVVTDGIFLDENIIFEDVTPEWIEFCKNDLKFAIAGD
jgi:hypothetical protein